MQRRNIEKAKILYDFLDQSKLFKGTVVPEDRSLMNVPFVTGDKDMDAKFVKEAKEAGLVNLKGHRTVAVCVQVSTTLCQKKVWKRWLLS